MLILDKFGIIQNLQTSSFLQTSFLVGTFFAFSFSKMALANAILQIHSRLETSWNYLWTDSVSMNGVYF